MIIIRHQMHQLLACPNIGRRLKAESLLSVQVANLLRELSLTGRYRGIWFKVANEGKRTAAAAAYLRAMGMICGTPDFAFLWSGGGGLIELKSSKGRLSDTQELFREWCDYAGVRHAICRTAQEVEATLREWGAI